MSRRKSSRSHCQGCGRKFSRSKKRPVHKHLEVGMVGLCEECGDTAKAVALEEGHSWPKSKAIHHCSKCPSMLIDGHWKVVSKQEKEEIVRQAIMLPTYACNDCSQVIQNPRVPRLIEQIAA